MSEHKSGGQRRSISPKDVFERSNMPSRWERLTGVSPKIPEDTVFLSFVAARYLGEQRLPHPAALVAPEELGQKQTADFIGGWGCVVSIILGVFALSASHPILFGIAALGLICAGGLVLMVSISTAPAIGAFTAQKAACENALSRLHDESVDPEYRKALNSMINCDEGTLAYCAAKIASEIQRQVAAQSARLETIAVNLWDELDQIGTSALEISEDREETERLERSRLRGTREVQETIAADKELRHTAIRLLAARVYAFADYRDQLHLLGTNAWRDGRITRRALRLTSDELAAESVPSGTEFARVRARGIELSRQTGGLSNAELQSDQSQETVVL